MAKQKTQFICQNCGSIHARWAGRCDACGAWNTIVEENPSAGIGGGPARAPKKGRPVALVKLDGESEEAPRIASKMAELDRVTGGGFVRGSAVLVGGDPGIGKSTILMQAAAALARQNQRVIYVSGEEAIAQVRLRARRLGAADTEVLLAAETNVEDILATLAEGPRPDLVIVDSIQTLWSDQAEAAPGTVTQVRTGVQAMIRFAKQTGTAMVLVGHVTKEGQLAGPRVVEHMVDTVLYFEGDRGHQFRIVRAVKNRFGATDEIAVFEMGDAGLAEVANPSALFLADREAPVSGACVFAGIEGTRPLLMELQALVAESPLGTPRRAVVGWDGARLAMVLAVLETRCGVRFGASDIYLNVAGGLRVREPAADLAAAAALLSALTDKPLPQKMVAFGEVSLAGEIRPVTQMEARLKEAAKLGFTEALVPAGAADSRTAGVGMRLREARNLHDIVPMIAAEAA